MTGTTQPTAPIVNGRALTGNRALRLRDFSAAVITGRAPGVGEIENAGVRDRRAPSREPGNMDEADQAALDMAERLAIRARHGETVRWGCILSASGIALAYERGVLDGECIPAANLRQIGERYRTAFESTNAMLTPVKHEVRGTGGLGAQDATLAAGKTLARLRARQTARHIDVLDRVCGYDLTAHRTSRLLHCRLRTVERLLCEALVTASHNHGAS